MPLILPGDPLFDQTLQSTLPFGSSLGSNYVVRADSGILEAVDARQLAEYVYGGEYDQLLELIGDDELEEYELEEYDQ